MFSISFLIIQNTLGCTKWFWKLCNSLLVSDIFFKMSHKTTNHYMFAISFKMLRVMNLNTYWRLVIFDTNLLIFSESSNNYKCICERFFDKTFITNWTGTSGYRNNSRIIGLCIGNAIWTAAWTQRFAIAWSLNPTGLYYHSVAAWLYFIYKNLM